MFSAFWSILIESALFILAGFLIAGFLHVLVSGDRVVRYLSAARSRSVFLATLLGAPLPLCSCSVLPAAITLRKKGASTGATLSFLISTPETGVTSILLTYSLLGPFLAVYRPVAACITAIVAGLAANIADRRDAREAASANDARTGEIPDGAGPDFGGSQGSDATRPHGSGVERSNGPFSARLLAGLRFSFVDLFDDIAAWIFVGIAAAAAIRAWIPPETLHTVLGGPLQSMILMALIGVPLYVCAEASTPIAAALIMQGVSPGAALVFLLCGPATNLGSIGVLNREFGRRTIVLYLAAIVLIALAMGGLLNLLAGDLGVNLGARALDEPLVPMPLKTLGAILFLAMAVFTARRRRYVERCAAWLDARFPGLVTVRRAKAAVAALLVAAYLASGFYVVSPGEAGIVRTFGAVSRSEVPPGLHFAWPYPVGRVDRVPVGRVERMLFGYRLAPDGTPTWQVDEDESWTLVGDENIADIRMALHFGVVAEELLSYQFAVSDRERLVRSAALAAVREVLGGASINQVLTTERRRYEREIEARIAERLDAYGTGIRVHSFHILDAHAPAQVHGAFRDIASALEDRDTEINRARAEEAKIVPLARGEAAGRRAEAEGHASRVVAQARGESDRFLALSRVHEKWPRVTQKRLEYETLEELFPKIRKYLKPADGDGGGLEIWFVDPSAVKEAPETLLQKP